MTSRTFAAGLLLATLGITVFAQDPEPKTKVKLYTSPQAVFDAFWGAVEKKDFKTAIDCLTPEALHQMIGRIAPETMEMRARGGKELSKENFKIISKILDRHGLTEKVAKDLQNVLQDRDQKKILAELLKHIKKPDAFVADMINAMAKIDPRKVSGPMQDMKLSDLKIDGDKASGNVAEALDVKDKDGGKREFKRPIEFARIKGGWRINPNPERDRPKAPKEAIKDK